MIIGSKKIPQNLVMADGKEITTKALQDIIKTHNKKKNHSIPINPFTFIL